MDLPRLSAVQMFWWSVGLLVGGAVANEVLARSVGFLGGGGSWVVLVATLMNLAQTLGVTGVVGAFVVRALEPRRVAREAPQNVDREQNV
ncbi:hypothetical protein [Cellulomonas fimi]|uniref:hypothetical protein n=1 Tax=Cellulomonas fimi TaxID=1708 RepID=UPI002358EE60|nr:hypothetical protein [Cellulomonas fimi]